MFYFLNCIKCKKSVKVSISNYRIKEKVYCNKCLKGTFDRIKKVIVEMVHYTEEPLKINFSDYLSEKLDYDYTYLSNLFSEVTGITIEHYIITHKIERVKELLMYDELTLTEISYLLNYSSVAHLSNQFKKETGMTPSEFKRLRKPGHQSLDNL